VIDNPIALIWIVCLEEMINLPSLKSCLSAQECSMPGAINIKMKMIFFIVPIYIEKDTN
jgi:hypothetical protein